MSAASTISLRPGSVIIFEGLDKAGKSTQIDLMKEKIHANSVVFAHMPSGFTKFTQRVYRALESKGDAPSSGLAQQLAHLACHAENMPELREATQAKALVLDRWWWSTLAYGWYGGAVRSSGLNEQAFNELIQSIWSPIVPSIIFAFLTPRQLDQNNATGVEDGYRILMERFADKTVLIPPLSPADTHMFITTELLRRNIAMKPEESEGAHP